MPSADRARLVPDWIPIDEQSLIDLDELVEFDAELDTERRRLEEQLGTHVAVYRAEAKGRPTGLCRIFRPAKLRPGEVAAIAARERRFPRVAFVAYSRPLVRW